MKTAEENPNGLHQKYVIRKTDGTPVDPNAEYFILRVDGHQKDKAHRDACLKALSVYAEAIKDCIPQLSEDLIERYNLSQFKADGRGEENNGVKPEPDGYVSENLLFFETEKEALDYAKDCPEILPITPVFYSPLDKNKAKCKTCNDWYGININHKCFKCLEDNFYFPALDPSPLKPISESTKEYGKLNIELASARGQLAGIIKGMTDIKDYDKDGALAGLLEVQESLTKVRNMIGNTELGISESKEEITDNEVLSKMKDREIHYMPAFENYGERVWFGKGMKEGFDLAKSFSSLRSESKGETVEGASVENEINQIIEDCCMEDGVHTSLLSEKLVAYFSSLRSSEPEIAPTEKDLAVLRTVLFQRTKQISEDLDSKKVSMYDHKGNKLYPATIIDEEMLRMANEIIDLVLKNSPTYEPLSEPEREGNHWTKPCTCKEEDKHGESWCCNHCGRMTSNHTASPPLKALSEITDEDLWDLVKIFYTPNYIEAAQNNGKDLKVGMFNMITTHIINHSEIYQYLQRKGYAVPVFFPVPEVKEKGESNEH